MNIKTASAIVSEQSHQLGTVVELLINLAIQINDIANEENSIIDSNDRIKALVASADIQMIALSSQSVLLQQALDQLATVIG